MPARPKAVSIVAAFLFLATAIAIVVGISILFPNKLLDPLWELNKQGAALFRRIGPLSGLFLLVLSGGTFSAAIGLLRRRKWAWWFAVVLFVVDGCGDVISFFATRELLRSATGVAITSAFLYAITRPAVRRYFYSPPELAQGGTTPLIRA